MQIVLYNIQMLGIELTERQKKIWSEMGDTLLATTEIQHLALQYYLQYRQNLNKNKLVIDDVQSVSNLINIAYFISEKNQITYNLRGERVGGVAFSINQIIKKNSNFQEFIYHMKEMLKVITIQDKFVQQQLENCLKKFKFTMTFHHKFVSTFKKIKPAPVQSDLTQSLLWLTFISIKHSMPLPTQTDIIQITCLIASMFIYYVEQISRNTLNLNGGEYQLDDANYGGSLRKQAVTHVFLEYFRIKDIAKYQEISSIFKENIADLKDNTGFDVLFAQRNLQNVYRKIDSLYMKKLTSEDIDERHFLKQRINTVMNANRFTPFGGRRHAPKNKSAYLPSQVLSHRVLNYDIQKEDKLKMIQNQQNCQTIQKNASILLKKLAQNRTPAQRTPLIKATPMTNAMQMYNWLLQKSSYHKYDPLQLSRYLKNDDKTLRLINGLWKDICMNENDRGVILNQKQKLAIMVLAAEIVYFVTNCTDSFQKIVVQLQLNWFQIWVQIDNVLNYDQRMPVSIRIHLLTIDTVLISKQLWRKQQLHSSIFKDQKLRTDQPEFDRLYRRVIHQIVYQIYFLCKKLSICQSIMNSIFLLCQHVLVQHTYDLLLHRTLYHIVLCSTYAISRTEQLELSFFDMLEIFKQMNGMGKEDYNQLVDQIYADDGREHYDIIRFYNQEFVKKNKPLLYQIKETKSANAINVIPNRKNIINSPVKDLLPRNIIALGDRTNKATPLQTPLTLALQAYHESPLLKQRRMKNLASCIDGRRIMQKKHDMTKEQSAKQTSMLINQKWRNTKSPEHKINITTVKKLTYGHEDNDHK